MTRLKTALLALGCLLPVAWGGPGTLPRCFTTHELGQPSALRYRATFPLRGFEVRGPSWLGSSLMHYRFTADTDQRRLAFLVSRWVAAPTELVETQMRRAFLLSHGGGAGCLVRIELDEFIQVFDASGTSADLIAAQC